MCGPAGPGLAAPGTLETTLARILCRLQHSTPARSPHSPTLKPKDPSLVRSRG